MRAPDRRLPVLLVVACTVIRLGPCQAEPSPARACLDQAKAATVDIQLAGDQSAALQAVALTLVEIDPPAVLDLAARMRRPSDIARSLGVVAVAMARQDPTSAAQHAVTAGRLLLRIADDDHRLAEQRLLVREIAPLGEIALVAGPELAPAEAQLEVVLGLAESEPAAARDLLRKWRLGEALGDQATAAIAQRLAATDPEEALEMANAIGSARVRDQAMWRIAEQRPPAEAAGIAVRVLDEISRSSILASAAARLAADDAAAAVAVAEATPVAPKSALAGVAVALAAVDRPRAQEIARSLPDLAMKWTLARIAVEAAGANPADVEVILTEAEADAQTIGRTAARMAKTDSERAVRTIRSLPPGDGRDAAMALVVRSLAAEGKAGPAKDLLWEIGSPRWRALGTEAVSLALAGGDADAATGLIGLVPEADRAAKIRCKVAVVVAPRDQELAARLLGPLPASDARTAAALQAGVAVLSAGGQPEAAAGLASLGGARDLALRWVVPQVTRSQTQSPVNLARAIQSPYARALALIDSARELLALGSSPRPAPERARQIRPIVEWEGR